MSLFLRSNLKVFKISRLKLFRNISQDSFQKSRVVCSNTGLLQNRLFGNAINTKPIYESVNDSQKFKNSISSTSTKDNENIIDELFKQIDTIVQRTGRTSIQSVDRILKAIEDKGFVTTRQGLYLLRCCNLLKSETPAERVKVAHEVWDKLIKLGMQLDVKNYNALLKVYISCKHSFKPSDILISMEQNNIEPNQTTYIHLMEKYCEDGDLNGANEILECIKEKGISVNEAVFHSLIKGHIKINDISGAKEIMEVMRNANMLPSDETYTVFISAIAEKGDIEKVEEMLLEAENNNIILDNSNYLQIIESLPSEEHAEFVEKILKKMKNPSLWRQDFMNTAAELTHKNMDNIAFQLVLCCSTRELPTAASYFIHQLIRLGRPVDVVINYCEQILDRDINNNIYINAVQESIISEKYEYLLDCFKRIDNSAKPVRLGTFRQLFSSQRITEKGVWQLVQCMSNLGIPIDFYTYMEDIFPLISTENPESVISQIQISGQTALSVTDALFQYYAMNGKLENALYIIERYPVMTNSYFKLDDYLGMYPHFSKNPVLYFKVLKDILNTGFPGKKTHILKGEQLALFLMTSPKLFDDFHKRLGEDVNYSSQSIEVCRNIIRNKAPDLMEHLRKFENKQNFNTKVIKEVSLDDEEKILNSTIESNPFKRAQLLELLTMHLKNRNVERMNHVKTELENTGFVVAPSMYSKIFFLYCEINNIDLASETLKKMKEAYPTFKVDTAKLFDYARLLLKYSRIDDVIDLIEKDCKEINNFSGNDYLLKSVRRFLNNVVQTGDIQFAKKVQELLKDYSAVPNLVEAISEPLLKIYMYRDDMESCLTEFNNCVVNNKCTPCLNLLLKKFIIEDDQSRLQALVDIASKLKGNTIMLHELAIAFTELDRLQQAKNIIENLGRDINHIFLTEVGMHYYSNNRSTDLENMLYITSGLKHNSRQVLYHHLLKLYKGKNDHEKVTRVLENMKKEGIEPSAESKELVNTLLQQNNQPSLFSDVKKEDKEYIPTDLDSINFLNYVKEKNVDRALKQLETMKKGYVRLLPPNELSNLIDLLIQKNRLYDLSPIVNAMSYIIENSESVFKPLLIQYSEEGNVEALQEIASVFPDFALRKNSFNNHVAKAYITSNRQEDLLKELENRWNMKNKLFSVSAFEELLKDASFETRLLELAKQYLSVNFGLPLALIWSHHFISERYEKADEISQIDNIMVDKVDSMVLRQVRQTENITMGFKYVEFVSQLNVKDRNKERAYGALLDLLVLKQMTDDAVSLVLDAKSKNLALEKHYRSTLITLKGYLEGKNKPVPFDIPQDTSN